VFIIFLFLLRCDQAEKEKSRTFAIASKNIDHKRGFKLPQNCCHNKLIMTLNNNLKPFEINKSWIENIIKVPIIINNYALSVFPNS
jgi:hypothetical protein